MSNITIPLLYEDSVILVIDKPAGVVVNRSESVKEPTAQDWADEFLQLTEVPQISIESTGAGKKASSMEASNPFDASDTFRSRSGIVHRLDKETSGCLIIAKNPKVFQSLQAAFKDRMVHKSYLALVHEKLVPQEGEIRAPVGRLPWNRERFGIVPGGKEAMTKYKVMHFYNDVKKNNYSLVELYPESGRTHQLRVHLKYIGHPIVGDYLYAGRKTQRSDRKWCPRVFLHAASIEFPHPVSETQVYVVSPLPVELATVLSRLVPL